jgi:hypothetical protein
MPLAASAAVGIDFRVEQATVAPSPAFAAQSRKRTSMPRSVCCVSRGS